MVINAQRTLYNVDLSLSMLLNKPYTLKPNTTLNEKFDILAGRAVPDGVYPTLKYWAIGTGGNSIIDTGTGFNYSEHGALDAALFNQIPFVMRKLQDDVDPVVAEKFRFRKVELIGNEQYACYYLKKIPGVTLPDQFYQVVTKEAKDGTKQSMLYLVDLNDPRFLNPEPRDRFINEVNIDSTVMYNKLAKLEFNLSEEEVKEIKKVIELKQIPRGQITEIAAVTGLEALSEGRYESYATQIGFHFGVNIDLTLDLNKKGELTRVLEIGGGEALLG